METVSYIWYYLMYKVHLSPLKSPPTKVRVPDKDQRVWNDDDDDGVPEDLLYDILNELREDMDDDYEPPTSQRSIIHNMQSMQYELVSNKEIFCTFMSITIREI